MRIIISDYQLYTQMAHGTNRTKSLLVAQFRNLVSYQNDSPKPKLKPFYSIPGPKPLPLIGNLWRYLPVIGNYKPDTLFENAQFNRKKYGPIVREELAKNHTILHLFDPEDIKQYFRQDGKYPYRRSHRALLKYRHDQPDKYRDGGLFPENGPNWYRQRNQFQQHLMSKSKVTAQTHKLDSVSLKMVRMIDSLIGQQFSIKINDFETMIYRWALGNSLSLFLDYDIDESSGKFVDEFIKQLHNTLIALEVTEIKSEKWVRKPEACNYYRMLADSQEFLYNFVQNQINHSQSSSGKMDSGVSYLNQWLNIEKLDQRDVISFIIDSLMAGLHTTSYTFAFLLQNISNNLPFLCSVRNELKTHVAPDMPLEADSIDKLTLLRDCLKETMRLNPISIGTGRLTSDASIHLRNYEIPQGTMIIAQNQTISRDGEIYADPNEFKPGRWASYRVCPRHLRPSPFASLPFGFGARSCIGQRVAELQIKILAARLLQQFDIKFEKEISTTTRMIHTLDGNIKATISRV